MEKWREAACKHFAVAFCPSSTSLLPSEVHCGFSQMGGKSWQGGRIRVNACMSEVGGWPGVSGCFLEGGF